MTVIFPSDRKRITTGVTGIEPPAITILDRPNEPLQYMRSQAVSWVAKTLKPNTRVYPFFDGQDVSEHCRTFGAGNAYGDPLVSDSNGELNFMFKIPPETFKVGKRMFVLTNNSTDPSVETDCYAIFPYTGAALPRATTSTRQDPVTPSRANSPREPSIERTVTIDPSTTTFKDPIAQTFFVAGNTNGIFATKIDVYFKTRPTDANVPITLQLRNTVNGNPSQNIVPLSTVTLYPKDVNVSDDATAATQFTFPSPVYLKNNEEYAIVLLPAGGRAGYEVWTAEFGENKIGTDEVIDKQPAAGRLYISSNSVNWTVSETKDLKFSLYNANFTASSGILYLKNKSVDYHGITSATIDIEPGYTFTGVTSGATGTIIHYNDTDDIAEVSVTSTTLFQDGETVNIAVYDGASATGTAVISLTPYTSEVEGKLVHELASALSYIDFNGTTANFEHKIYDSSETDPGTYSPINKIDLFTPGEEKAVYSYSYERNASGLNITDSDLGTFMLKGTLSTSNSNISPVVDLGKSQFITYTNKVRAVRSNISGLHTYSTSSTTVSGDSNAAYFDHVTKGAVLRDGSDHVIGVVRSISARDSLTLTTNAYKTEGTGTNLRVDYEASDIIGNAKYHTKYVTLPEGNFAEDIVVFMDASIPSGTNVHVYGRILAPGDSSDVKLRPWTRFLRIVNVDTLGAGEYQFRIPKNGNDENTVVGGLNSSSVYQYTTASNTFTGIEVFAIKIVLTSHDTYYRPEVYNMRALALQA